MSQIWNYLSVSSPSSVGKLRPLIQIITSQRTQFYSNLHNHQAKVMRKGLPVKKPIDGVKHIILVSSGKGGVGKSTVSVNLAVGLQVLYPTKNIGLLDADVFGPSIPLMMNLHESPLLNDKNLMIPLTNYGVKCMSLGFLIGDNSVMIWRGLMVMQALDKLLRQVAWEGIDYLIVDTPPGTGDTHLSLAQNVPISGTIIVTTPQTASLQVAKRGALMYEKLSVPLIGIVENMCSVTCLSCSNVIKIFGEGTATLANEIKTQVLQSFPLNEQFSICTDIGTPVVVKYPECPESKAYLDLAKQIVQFIDKTNVDS